MNETKAILYDKGIYINADAGMPYENPDIIFRLAAEYFGINTVYVLDCAAKTVYTYSRQNSISLDELMKLREISVYAGMEYQPIPMLISQMQLDEIAASIDGKITKFIKIPTRHIAYDVYEVYGYMRNDDGIIIHLHAKKCSTITCYDNGYNEAIELLKCHYDAAR